MPTASIRAERRYHQLLENLNDAVYTVDINGNFTSVNKAAEKMTGYTKEELTKLNFIEIVAPESLPLVRQKISQKIKKDIATIYEIEIIRKNGVKVPVEISSKAIYKEESIVEILGIARDITERKQLEHQKEVFLSLLTHEIKNPLTTIKGYTQLLKKSRPDKVAEYIKIIDQQIDSLVNLMNDFLEVSRVRMNRFTISKELIDIDEVIDETIALFSKNSTHQVIKKGKTAGIVLGDKGRLFQVLVNLMSNSIKYSPEAKKIEIEVRKEKRSLIIGIKDYGIGIPKAHLKKIFDLFYRVNHPAHTSIKGYGLGLFICKEIIQSHKGKIWVESKEGYGSTFFISLPTYKKGELS